MVSADTSRDLVVPSQSFSASSHSATSSSSSSNYSIHVTVRASDDSSASSTPTSTEERRVNELETSGADVLNGPRASAVMSDSRDGEEAGGEGRRYNLRDRGNRDDAAATGNARRRRSDGDEEEEGAQNDDLTTILRYLVRTGQVRLMSSRRPLGEAVYIGGPSVIDDEADDDDDDDSDATFEDDDRIDHQPEVDPTPDVQDLRSSDFMQVERDS